MKHMIKHIMTRNVATVLLVLLVVLNLFLVGFVVHDTLEKRFIREVEEYVDLAVKEFGIPKAMVFAVIKTESDFDRYARSSADARGLMQITATALSDINRYLSEEYKLSQMYDPKINIRCGVAYLFLLYRKYNHYDTALAAYNAGQGNVDDWLNDSCYSSDRKTLKEIPFEETREYVKTVNRYLNHYEKQYGDI